MYLKRFRSLTVREGLIAVRDALGPDAIVLSTRMVPVAGWRGLLGQREVEITAGAERELSERRREESADRQLVTDYSARDVAARLTAAGLDQAMADEIARAIPPPNRRGASPQSVRVALADRLKVIAAPDREYARVEVFVGPPGAGKTTTIAKIAAQERARGGQRLGLVAADGYRVGAVEQLRTYAEILDAPFRVARTPADLDRALAARYRHPILVDTAGRSPADDGVRELLRVVASGQGVRTHLVLPASTPVAAARRIVETYADANPTRLVLTKLDEAESWSPLVGFLRDRQLPVSYLSAGQRVPEDLDRATAQRLAASVLGESTPLLASRS